MLIQDRIRGCVSTFGNNGLKRPRGYLAVYVCGETGAGGLVAPLPCTAYFGKFKIASYIVWLFLATASASVGLVHLYSYHNLASLRSRTYLARTTRVH